MTDNGTLAVLTEWFSANRESRDNRYLAEGWLLSYLVSRGQYGDGVIDHIAINAGYSRRTLYGRIAVWHLVEQLCAIWGIVPRRSFFERRPDLTYSHILTATRLEFEAAADALIAVSDGDSKYPDYDAMLPMSVDCFRHYIKELGGKGNPTPLYQASGVGYNLLGDILRSKPPWLSKAVRIRIMKVE